MKLRITWQYLVAFSALLMLCGSAHEFAHHFTGAAVCRAWGQKTFGTFSLAEGCEANPRWWWASVAGPIFTFAMLWIGAMLLRRESTGLRSFGFALIFANVPFNRMFVALTGHNDEQWLAHKLYPQSLWTYWVVVAIVWIICVPPLVMAWRAIENRNRLFWFAGFYLLPFAFLPLQGMVFENYLLLSRKVLAQTVYGIPYLVIVVDLFFLAVLLLWGKHLTGRGLATLDWTATSHPEQGLNG
jgi:hypothetical protein